MSVGGILKQIAAAAWRVFGMLLYVTLSLVVLATGAYYWRRYQQNHEVEQPPTPVQSLNSPALTADPRVLNIVGAKKEADPESDTPPTIVVSKPDRPAQRVLLSAATAAQLREAFRFQIKGINQGSSALVPVEEGGKSGYVDPQGRWVFPPQFGFAEPFVEGRARVSWGRPHGRPLVGFIDTTGRWLGKGLAGWVIEAKYDSAQPSPGGRSLVSKDGRVGWIEATGKEHFSPDYNVLQLSDDGRAVAAKDCGIGVVDASGQWIVPPVYGSIMAEREGFFVVNRNGAAALVTSAGRFLTPKVPDGPHNISEVATDVSGGGWQFIDTAGHDLGPDVLEEASDFHEGHAVIRMNGAYGVIDRSGNITVPLIFRQALHDFHEGRAAAKSNWGGWGYIDSTCHWATEVGDEEAELDNDTREGLRRLALNGRWGFVDAQGQWVIPAQFEDESSFSEGSAAVQRAGKWGFIDKSGKVIVPAQFEAAVDFHSGWARVGKQDRWTYVNQRGELISKEATFSDAGDFSADAARVKTSSGKWGYIDKTGGWLIEPAYVEAADFSEGRARVRLQAGPYRSVKSTHAPAEGAPLLVDGAGWFGSGLGYVCARQNFNGCALINAAGELLILPPPQQTESAQ